MLHHIQELRGEQSRTRCKVKLETIMRFLIIERLKLTES